MIVCICNRLTDTMIAKAVADGARNQADVLRRYRMHRGCSACSVKIAETIQQALADLNTAGLGNSHPPKLHAAE